MIEKEFKVNDYITLKLKKDHTIIYVNGEKFNQCKYLAFQININQPNLYENIQSIDEMEQKDNSRKFGELNISPEEEFWGHCSNLHAWVENDYNTRLLHRNLAFPLLKRLTELGDPLANKVFKDDIGNRLKSNYPPVVKFLCREGYVNYLDIDEILSLGGLNLLFNIANNLIISWNREKAIKYFEKILSIDPEFPDIWYKLSVAYRIDRKVSEAIKHLKSALNSYPNNISILKGLAEAYSEKNNPLKAIKYYHQILSLDSKNIEFLKKLSNEFTKMNEFEKAIIYLEKAVSIKPEDDIAWLDLSSNYEKLGDLEKANECIRTVEEMTSNPNLSKESILGALDINSWRSIKDLIFRLKIKKMGDARLLQVKLIRMAQGHQILMEIRNRKKNWKLK